MEEKIEYRTYFLTNYQLTGIQSGIQAGHAAIEYSLKYQDDEDYQEWARHNKTFIIIGCIPEYLKEHIENQFTDGMCWENYGLYGWHIDHIIPLSSANTEDEIYKLCHYTNLQPLWAEENMKKSNKLILN